MSKKPDEFSFLEHLDELRDRLIKCIIVIFITSFVFYFFIDQFLILIVKPVGKLIFTSPQDAFIARLTLTIFGGLFLSLPFIFYHIWQFVYFALKENEKKYVSFYAPLSVIFFLLGSIFAYFVAVPLALHFLLGFSSELIVPMITIKNYISFVGTLILAFGVVFELPLVLMFLTKIGIATPAFLIQKRKYAVVLILTLSALFTPPDIITQVIMAGPLLVLYELGILFSKLTCRDEG